MKKQTTRTVALALGILSLPIVEGGLPSGVLNPSLVAYADTLAMNATELQGVNETIPAASGVTTAIDGMKATGKGFAIPYTTPYNASSVSLYIGSIGNASPTYNSTAVSYPRESSYNYQNGQIYKDLDLDVVAIDGDGCSIVGYTPYNYGRIGIKSGDSFITYTHSVSNLYLKTASRTQSGLTFFQLGDMLQVKNDSNAVVATKNGYNADSIKYFEEIGDYYYGVNNSNKIVKLSKTLDKVLEVDVDGTNVIGTSTSNGNYVLYKYDSATYTITKVVINPDDCTVKSTSSIQLEPNIVIDSIDNTQIVAHVKDSNIIYKLDQDLNITLKAKFNDVKILAIADSGKRVLAETLNENNKVGFKGKKVFTLKDDNTFIGIPRNYTVTFNGVDATGTAKVLGTQSIYETTDPTTIQQTVPDVPTLWRKFSNWDRPMTYVTQATQYTAVYGYTDNTFKENNVVYGLNADGKTVTVVGFDNVQTATIPSVVNHGGVAYNVTSVLKYGVTSNATLDTLKVDASLIQNNLFQVQNIPNIKKMIIDGPITTMPAGFGTNCPNLKIVKAPISCVATNTVSGYYKVDFLDEDQMTDLGAYYVKLGTSMIGEVTPLTKADETFVKWQQIPSTSASTVGNIQDNVTFAAEYKSTPGSLGALNKVPSFTMTPNKIFAPNRDNTVQVSFSNLYSGTDYYYTLNGSIPSATNGQKLYSTLLNIPMQDTDAATTVKLSVVGVRTGLTNSDVQDVNINFASKENAQPVHVRFMDRTYNLIKEADVPSGSSVDDMAPSNDSMKLDGYTFLGWSENTSSVKQSTTFRAMYEKNADTGSKIDTTNISVINNGTKADSYMLVSGRTTGELVKVYKDSSKTILMGTGSIDENGEVIVKLTLPDTAGSLYVTIADDVYSDSFDNSNVLAIGDTATTDAAVTINSATTTNTVESMQVPLNTEKATTVLYQSSVVSSSYSQVILPSRVMLNDSGDGLEVRGINTGETVFVYDKDNNLIGSATQTGTGVLSVDMSVTMDDSTHIYVSRKTPGLLESSQTELTKAILDQNKLNSLTQTISAIRNIVSDNLDNFSPTNTTSASKVEDALSDGVTDPYTSITVSNFYKVNATTDADGSVTGTITIHKDGESDVTIPLDKTIDKSTAPTSGTGSGSTDGGTSTGGTGSGSTDGGTSTGGTGSGSTGGGTSTGGTGSGSTDGGTSTGGTGSGSTDGGTITPPTTGTTTGGAVVVTPGEGDTPNNGNNDSLFDSVVQKIKDFIDGFTAKNSTTQSSLKDSLEKLLGSGQTIKVDDFEKDKATSSSKGSITATITLEDTKGNSETFDLDKKISRLSSSGGGSSSGSSSSGGGSSSSGSTSTSSSADENGKTSGTDASGSATESPNKGLADSITSSLGAGATSTTSTTTNEDGSTTTITKIYNNNKYVGSIVNRSGGSGSSSTTVTGELKFAYINVPELNKFIKVQDELVVQNGTMTIANSGDQTYFLTVQELPVEQVVAQGWYTQDSKTYFIDAKGIHSGWLLDNGSWYYMDNKYKNKSTGWIKTADKWYLLDQDGKMKTGWVQDGGSWYYLNETNGDMTTGWKQIGSTWYYFNQNGSMATGWKSVDTLWYYLNTDGSMAHDTNIDGYNLGSDGALIK